MVACSNNDASKSWSALAYCLVGDAAPKPTPERMKQLRAIQLSNAGKPDKPDGWPARCATYASQLYAALDSSGSSAGFKRSLQSKLGCGSDKPSCVLNNDTVVTLVSDLWDQAKASELKLEPAGSIPKPEITQQPAMTKADWAPLLKQAGQVVGPQVTADGRVQLIVKTSGARMRPWGCEFKAGFAEAQCFSANDKVPLLPPQSIALVNDPKDFYVAGLTEAGLAAFDMRTGDTGVARGLTGNVFHDGLAVERGENDKGWTVDGPKPAQEIVREDHATIFRMNVIREPTIIGPAGRRFHHIRNPVSTLVSTPRQATNAGLVLSRPADTKAEARSFASRSAAA